MTIFGSLFAVATLILLITIYLTFRNRTQEHGTSLLHYLRKEWRAWVGRRQKSHNQDQEDPRLLPPRRSLRAWIGTLLWILIPSALSIAFISLSWETLGKAKNSLQSVEFDLFSLDWFWDVLAHPVTWAIGGAVLVVLIFRRVRKNNKVPEWKSVKEFVSGTMYVVLFLGACAVFYYGIQYMRSEIPKSLTNNRTIIATPQGTTVAFSCPYQYKWENGRVGVFDRNGRLINTKGDHVDHGRSPDFSKLTFYGNNIPVKITEEASC